MPEGNPEGYIDDDPRRPTQEQLNEMVRKRTEAGAKTEGKKKKKDKKNGKKNRKPTVDFRSFREDYEEPKPVE
jgi:CRISPR/Cas system CSM-associated protein Csm4 (group 5 of RAMP superfamily)